VVARWVPVASTLLSLVTIGALTVCTLLLKDVVAVMAVLPPD
jgi:hypothetical protein